MRVFVVMVAVALGACIAEAQWVQTSGQGANGSMAGNRTVIGGTTYFFNMFIH